VAIRAGALLVNLRNSLPSIGKQIKQHFAKKSFLFGAVASAVFLSGCGGSSSSQHSEPDNTPVSKFAIPQALQSKPFPEDGELKAYVILDEGRRREMTISGENAEYKRAITLLPSIPMKMV